MTYSIVGRDPATGELGVGVQTKAFAVGRAVPWARAGVGAVATQSFTEQSYGPLGLELMQIERSAEEALSTLLATDAERHIRQVAMIDAEGRVAAHTGERCIPETGHLLGDGFSVQANSMRNADVWPAMAEAFTAAEGTLARRLLAALDGAEGAGGDFRGKQAAALLVVSGKRSDRPWEERVSDLRVDDHTEPLAELRRLLELDEAYRRLTRIEPGDSVDEEVERARAAGVDEDQVATALARAAWRAGDPEEARRRMEPLLARDRRWQAALELFTSTVREELRPRRGGGKSTTRVPRMATTAPDRLYFTTDDEANELIARDPLALLIGFVLDQQVSVQKAFSSPLELKRRLGALDAEAIAGMDPAELERVFRERPALHRFPGNMARRVQEFCAALVTDYGGRAERVWTEAADARELQRRLLGLPGIGAMKAGTIVALLAKRFGVRPEGWETVAPEHPTLGDVDSAEALERYQEGKRAYKARLKGLSGK